MQKSKVDLTQQWILQAQINVLQAQGIDTVEHKSAAMQSRQ